MANSSSVKSITLPSESPAFRNLKNAKGFALDIGGSLTKIAYYSTVAHREVLYSDQSDDITNYAVSVGERLHFVKFETKFIEACLDFIRQNLLESKDTMVGKVVKVTGSGAFRFGPLIHEKLGLDIDKEDEIACVIKGCNFLLRNIPDEVYSYQRNESPEYKFEKLKPSLFPYLLVNIGSGVSIMKVDSDDCYERVGGTATGGATFFGLGHLLTQAKTFEDLLELAAAGDHRNVDMLVKDIYGGNYESQGLPGDLIAASFGNVQTKKHSEADIARSLLYTISNDIGQIACLYAMLHKIKTIFFGGYFLHNQALSKHTISYSINYWGKGEVQALFLRHEGYLGAIGAFLIGGEETDRDKYSWTENYAGSSGIDSAITSVLSPENFTVNQLEMDQFDGTLVFCPLLKCADLYVPDTVNLAQDAIAREYWLECFEMGLDQYIGVAVQSQKNGFNVEERAGRFKDKYLSKLKHLREHPCAYGSLTVRSLLDMRDHCLFEFDFPDPYCQQKQCENEEALGLLHDHLKKIDQLEWKERQEALMKGVLTGNIFDWGAKEVVCKLKKGDFGFDQAASFLQSRPWLFDDLDFWVDSCLNKKFNVAAIFVDNSGCDIVLGIFPLARELLRCGVKVILCANTKPALNDVTYQELQFLVKKVAEICPIIKEAAMLGTLRVMDSGQTGPCLDLSRLNQELASAMLKEKVDLIVLEGMGRSIHTNLFTAFNCYCLKVAVLKNKWLAERLGGPMYSVVCKFESPPKN